MPRNHNLYIKFIVTALIVTGTQAYAFNALLKSDGGPTEQGLKTFLQQEFASPDLEIISYERAWASYNPSELLEKTLIRDLIFSVTREGKILKFSCRVIVRTDSLDASVAGCRPDPNVSLADLAKVPKWSPDKAMVFDYLNDKLKPEDREQIYEAYKTRMEFDGYSCNGGTPAFLFSGSGEKLSLAVTRDESSDFAIYSTPSSQSATKIATGSPWGLKVQNADGKITPIGADALQKYVNDARGARNLALSAGVYNREDLKNASVFLAECCKDKTKCPKARPQPVNKTLVQGAGVSR